MESLTFKVRGVSQLIVHNGQLSDPLNEHAKAIAKISKKRGKTEADHVEMGRLEWYGCWYLDDDGRPIIPGENLERMFRDAAAKSKNGKDVQAGLIVPDDALIEYEGPKSIDKMWKSGDFTLRVSAKVGQARVMRTRPIFDQWGLTFTAMFDETILDPEQVGRFVEIAGRIIGIGTWRPRHGRFEIVS